MVILLVAAIRRVGPDVTSWFVWFAVLFTTGQLLIGLGELIGGGYHLATWEVRTTSSPGPSRWSSPPSPPASTRTSSPAPCPGTNSPPAARPDPSGTRAERSGAPPVRSGDVHRGRLSA